MAAEQWYDFRLPGVVRVGLGAHRTIPDDVLRLSSERVLVVSDANCARIPQVAATVDALRARVSRLELFTAIPSEPTTGDVEAGLEALRRISAEVVVGVGGGSVLDTAKAIAAMATNPGTIADYMGRDRLTRARLPLVLVPTTAGTGSEATRYTVITDPRTDVKMLITDWRLLPDVAVVDPLLCVGSPPAVTASTGVDALTHAIEAYVSQRHQPTADLFALAAMRRMPANLIRAYRDGGDLEARAETALGALEGGIAFCNSSVALVHGMSRPIGAYFHVPHGLSNAMLLPTVTRWSIEGARERYAEVATALGLEAAEAIPEFLADLSRTLGIPRLGEVVDVTRLRDVAPRMAQDALASGSPQNNPRVPTEQEIVGLFERCL